MASPVSGCYALVQYVPDAERAEGTNVAVLLFDPRDHRAHFRGPGEPSHLARRILARWPDRAETPDLAREIDLVFGRVDLAPVGGGRGMLEDWLADLTRELKVLRFIWPRSVALDRSATEHLDALYDRLVK